MLGVPEASGASGVGEAAREALREALREHGAALGRVCMALLGEHAAVEAALERVARAAGDKGLPTDRGAKVFLMGLAHRACTAQMSKAPSRRDEAPAPERTGAAAAASESRAALAKLRPTEREAVVLHLVGGLTAVEVADACGVDAKVARERIRRALSQLAETKREGGR